MSNLFPYYPVFLDLAGRSVVLIGADAAIVGLARQFLAAGRVSRCSIPRRLTRCARSALPCA